MRGEEHTDTRTKTGIQDLDKALNGGIPAGNIVLVSGGAGTGKSTLVLQYLVNGASTFGEKGLYISTEQTVPEVKRMAANFGWNIDDLEQKNLLKIVYFDVTSGKGFLKELEELASSFNPDRMVIDSLTTLTDALLVSGMGEGTEFSMVQIAETVNPIPRTDKIISKSILYSLFRSLKKYFITTVLTSELSENSPSLSADGVSEFIADGVITLKALTVGDSSTRNLEIKKMRYTPIVGGINSYTFSEDGISFD